ncbi:MAG: type 4a pilus biogenesis protein PilO [Planctomycetota bacterium]
MIKLNLNRKKKAWLIAGVSFVMVLGCAGVVWTDHGAIEEEQSRIGKLKSEILSADATIAKIKTVEDRVLSERVRVKEYTKILPLDKDINNFVDRITEFEAAAKVEISTLDDKSARNRNKKKSKDAFIRIGYKMNVTATIGQLLEFMHLFESYDRFVTVKEFNIKGANPVELADGTLIPARHGVGLTLETYVYKPTNAMKQPVKIVNADERMLGISESLGLAKGLELDAYAYEERPNRRDPFSNPRHLIEEQTGSGEGAEIAEQEEVLDELVTEFNAIREQLKSETKEEDLVVKYELSRRLDARLGELRDRVTALDIDKFFSSPEARQRYRREVGDPLSELLKERLGADLELMPLDEVKSQYTRMQDSFDKEQFTDTIALGQTLMKSRVEGMPDELNEAFEEVLALIERAQIRIDFDQIEMVFNGLVVPGGDESKSIVIINGRAYSPGDEYAEGLTVKEVRSSGIRFLYRGERITRTLD